MRNCYMCLIVMVCCFFVLPLAVQARSDIPANNLCYPVLVTLNDGSTASGFYFRSDGFMHFVTAKHVLYSPNGILKSKTASLLSYGGQIEDSKKIVMNVDLGELQKKGLIRSHQQQDVSVIQLGKVTSSEDGKNTITYPKGIIFIKSGENSTVSATLATAKDFSDILVGNEIFIFGYPSSIGIKEMDQIKYDQPLLRRGIIAGKNNDKKTLILDCPSYYGNSGGPVVEVERVSLTKTQYRLIGLVSEFVPFKETWVNATHKFSYWDISNSGYSVVVPFDPIRELLWNRKDVESASAVE